MKNKDIYRALLTSIIVFTLLLVGKTAIATNSRMITKETIYKITSKIFIDGNLVSSPQIMTLPKQKASIFLADKNTSLRLAVIAEDITKDNIKINYDLHYENGNNKIHAKPVMVLVPNQEGIIHIASGTNHSYEMRVLAERQSN